MRTRLAPLSSALLLLSTLGLGGLGGLGACDVETNPSPHVGGPTPEPAPVHAFADASPALRERIIRAGAGLDAQLALALVRQIPAHAADCPRVVTSGADVVVTGGCSLSGGRRLDGSATLTGIGFADPVTGAPGALSDAWRIHFGNLTITSAATGSSAASRYVFDGDVQSARGKLVVRLGAEVDGIFASTALDLDGQGRGIVEAEGVDGPIAVSGIWSSDLARGSGAMVLGAGETLTTVFQGESIQYLLAGSTWQVPRNAPPQLAIATDLAARRFCRGERTIVRATANTAYTAVEFSYGRGVFASFPDGTRFITARVPMTLVTRFPMTWELDVGSCTGFDPTGARVIARIGDDNAAASALR